MESKDRAQRRNHDRRNLWPWRDWMTIGIGVLASDPQDAQVKPNHIVLLADTMGSFGDAYSHPRLHKTFAFPEADFYATAAGNVDEAAILLPMIGAKLAAIKERSVGDILRCLSQGLFMFKMEKFSLTKLPKYGLPPASIAPTSNIRPSSLIAAMGLVPDDMRQKIEKAWKRFNLGCDLIIGAFDKQGQAVLVYLYGNEDVFHNGNLPGYWAIGSGGGNALFWLSQRAHTLGMGVKRAAYHAYEAKLMAEASPMVNEHLDITIAKKGKWWNITTHKNTGQKDCPVSFAELKEWYEKYGPRDTASLDIQAASAVAK